MSFWRSLYIDDVCPSEEELAALDRQTHHEAPSPHPRDPRRAYRVVDDFEAELADYTRAPYAVTVDSCTNALYLSLLYERLVNGQEDCTLPRHTYVGVLQAARNAGLKIHWYDDGFDWQRDFGRAWYTLSPVRITDSARHIGRGMYTGHWLTCLSFHAAKQLPLGRGGAILTDDPAAAEWLRAARMDGRPPGAPIAATQFPGFHCPMPPDVAARGLWILSRWNDAGYDPPPLPPEQYPDLSQLEKR